jgi:hypothetical protein
MKFFIAFYMATIPVHFESRYAPGLLASERGSTAGIRSVWRERFTTSERQHTTMVSSMASATRSASKYFFGCRNSKVEQSDFDMYVQACEYGRCDSYRKQRDSSIKPGVEFLTSSFVTQLLCYSTHIRTSPYLRWYALALALYVINAWGVPLHFGPCVAGDVMTLITKAVDEITSRIQISGMDQVEESLVWGIQ